MKQLVLILAAVFAFSAVSFANEGQAPKAQKKAHVRKMKKEHKAETKSEETKKEETPAAE